MTHFTSDGHFWHANVLKYCPNRKFATIEEMNEALIANWNSVVGPDDTVYHLGDFSLAIRPVEIYTRRLNGRKVLISGNHDWTHPANKKARKEGHQLKWEKKYIECGWEAVHLQYMMTLKNGTKARLYHMPYLDLKDDKQNHKQWRLEDDGIPLICGHIHQYWTMRWTHKNTPMLNVGVDRWNCTPVSEDKVIEAFENAKRPEKQAETEGRGVGDDSPSS